LMLRAGEEAMAARLVNAAADVTRVNVLN